LAKKEIVDYIFISGTPDLDPEELEPKAFDIPE
jgi:hypothetical protein